MLAKYTTLPRQIGDRRIFDFGLWEVKKRFLAVLHLSIDRRAGFPEQCRPRLPESLAYSGVVFTHSGR